MFYNFDFEILSSPDGPTYILNSRVRKLCLEVQLNFYISQNEEEKKNLRRDLDGLKHLLSDRLKANQVTLS